MAENKTKTLLYSDNCKKSEALCMMIRVIDIHARECHASPQLSFVGAGIQIKEGEGAEPKN